MIDPIKRRIEIFTNVRDLPFYMATHGEQDCSCSTKAYLLEDGLSKIGLECRHRLCWFKWEGLNLPNKILKIEHESLSSHQFLEVYIPESTEWVVVDPTWDTALRKIFPINDWDGISTTKCAVPVERFCTTEETEQIFRECSNPEYVQDYLQNQEHFLRAINDYLHATRLNRN